MNTSHKIRNRNSAKVPIIALLVLVFATFTVRGQQESYTPEFQRLLQTVDLLYFQRNNLDMKTMMQLLPSTVALIMGNALGRQAQFQPASDPLGLKFFDLQMDVRFFLDDVAQAASFMDENGNALDGDRLNQIMLEGMQGRADALLARDYGVSREAMPNILVPPGSADAQSGPAGGLVGEDSVELLRVVPNPEPVFNSEPEGARGIAGLWKAKVEKMYLCYGYERMQKDENPNLFFDIQISRTGDTYVARILTSASDRTYWNGKELFQVKFDKGNGNGYDFMGQIQSIPVASREGIWVPSGPSKWVQVRVEYYPASEQRKEEGLFVRPDPGNSSSVSFTLFRPGDPPPPAAWSSPFLF